MILSSEAESLEGNYAAPVEDTAGELPRTTYAQALSTTPKLILDEEYASSSSSVSVGYMVQVTHGPSPTGSQAFGDHSMWVELDCRETLVYRKWSILICKENEVLVRFMDLILRQ